jgi:hypothetical protein
MSRTRVIQSLSLRFDFKPVIDFVFTCDLPSLVPIVSFSCWLSTGPFRVILPSRAIILTLLAFMQLRFVLSASVDSEAVGAGVVCWPGEE